MPTVVRTLGIREYSWEDLDSKSSRTDIVAAFKVKRGNLFSLYEYVLHPHSPVIRDQLFQPSNKSNALIKPYSVPSRRNLSKMRILRLLLKELELSGKRQEGK